MRGFRVCKELHVAMRFLRSSSLLFVAILLFVAGAARAQSVDTGGLEVDIRDASGALIPGATLTLTQVNTHDVRTGVSDAKGRYRFVEMPPGNYELTVSKSGFSETIQKGITLSVGQAAQLQISMSNGAASETVQVNADVSTVDPDRTTIGQTIDSVEIENLPSNGRNFLDFAITAPGVTVTQTTGQNSGFSVNGQRSRSNSIQIDGVENNGALNGNVRQTLSQDAIAQFQVLTEQFPAEFGGAGGGFINVVTKAGSDQLHGSAYYYIRNDFLTINNNVTSTTPSTYNRNDLGMSIGGPIKSNRTFFFGALEYIGLNTNVPSSSTVIGIAANCINVVPLTNPDGTPVDSNGNILTNNAAKITCHLRNPANYFKGSSIKTVGTNGFIPQSSAQTLSSLRFDHRISDRTTLIGRVLYVQYIQANSTDAGSIYDFTTATGTYTHTQNYFAELTHVYSPTLLSETHLMVAPQRLKQLPNSSGPGADEGGSVIWGPTADFPVTLDEDHYEADHSFSKTLNSHLFKAGVQVNYVRAHSNFPSYFAGEWNFSTIANFAQYNIPSTYQQSFGNPDIHLNDTLLGFYLEDSWKATSRLTVNYGLRYDLDLEPQGFNLNKADPIQTNLPKGIPRDYNNFGPRIAAAYSLDKNGKTVLRAGYGIFYDKNILILARNQLLPVEKLVLNASTTLSPTTQYITGPLPQSTAYPSGLGAPPSIAAVAPNLVIPMIHQADFGIDRALTSRIVLSVTGVHVEGEKLLKAANNNLAPPVILTTANQQTLGFSAPVAYVNSTTYYTCSPTLAAPTSAGTQPNFQQCGRPYYYKRANPNFTDISTVGPWGHSNYNGLRATLTSQAWHNLTVRAGFVWSRAEDDAPDFLNGALPDNPYFPHGEKSLSNEDVRNRFTGTFVYRVPFRAGRGGLDWTKWLFANWIFSGTVVSGSGTPENITVGSDANNDDSTADRPFINGVIVGRNKFRGARTTNVNVRGQKEIRLPRGQRLTFSAEAFNALERLNATNYNTVWGTLQAPGSSFANLVIPSSVTPIQLGLKYVW